jgi:hypothetical protein
MPKRPERRPFPYFTPRGGQNPVFPVALGVEYRFSRGQGLKRIYRLRRIPAIQKTEPPSGRS